MAVGVLVPCRDPRHAMGTTRPGDERCRAPSPDRLIPLPGDSAVGTAAGSSPWSRAYRPAPTDRLTAGLARIRDHPSRALARTRKRAGLVAPCCRMRRLSHLGIRRFGIARPPSPLASGDR